MKKVSTNQEILLIPGTSFFKKDWCAKSNNENLHELSPKEQLKVLCWNGLLAELLPEITETDNAKKQLTIWEVCETNRLIDLRLGEFNQLTNDEWSINPFVFLMLAEMN
jgi:hypothetical protein